MDRSGGDRDDHVSREHCGAQRRKEPQRQARPAREFDRCDEERSRVRERDVYLHHSPLKHAELGFYEQLGPAGNTEKDPDQDAGRSHWHPLPGAKHRQALWITCVIFRHSNRRGLRTRRWRVAPPFPRGP